MQGVDPLALTSSTTAALTDLRPLLAGFAGLLGLIIGSFLNVVIYRVPAGLSVVRPRSACPSCQTPIRSGDNIPVVSWLALRGKCRRCKAPISVRYPLVEATTGLLFAATTWWGLVTVPALLPALLYGVAVGVALFLIDVDTKRLPDAIVLPSYPVLAALLALAGVLSGQWPVATVAGSALVWWSVFYLPYKATKGRGMGFGDVKLAPLLGAVLGVFGWGPALVGLMASFVFGVLVSIVLMRLGRAGRKSKIPFGPFMLLGTAFGVIAGDSVFSLYLSVSGIA